MVTLSYLLNHSITYISFPDRAGFIFVPNREESRGRVTGDTYSPRTFNLEKRNVILSLDSLAYDRVMLLNPNNLPVLFKGTALETAIRNFQKRDLAEASSSH